MTRRTTSPSEVVIRQRARALERSLPGARKGDVALVHQARVATRRLREAVPLIVRGARGRKFERRMRRLTRALGPVRELDVALETLDELSTAGAIASASIARLRQEIRLERERVHAHMCTEVSHVDVERLRRKLVAAARRPQPDPARARARDPKRIARARARAARRAARLRGAVQNAGAIYLPDRLHEVRVAVKKLRYALEVARELSGSRAVAQIRTLKQVQDLLGRMHDLEVLILRVRGLQGSPQAPTLRISANLDHLVRHLETECRQIHGRYVTMRRKLLAICDATEKAAAGRHSSGVAASAA
jgi:CHAD domain-containing protein